MWNRKKKRKIDPETGKREYRKKSPLKRLEKKADDLTRDIIRLICDWHCQKCNKYITKKSDAHRAHIVSCGHKLLRWDLLNLLLLCFHCHQECHSDGQLKELVKKKWHHIYEYLFEQSRVTGGPLRCNELVSDMTQSEKIEWMQKIIAELEEKLEELKG